MDKLDKISVVLRPILYDIIEMGVRVVKTFPKGLQNRNPHASISNWIKGVLFEKIRSERSHLNS